MAQRIRRAAGRLGATRGFFEVMRVALPALDRVVQKVTGGRWNVARGVLPTLTLIHTGRKTGRSIRTPLTYVRSGAAYGVAATNWGREPHPSWSANLIAHPDITVEIGGKTIPVRAKLLDSTEKNRLWSSFVDLWPAYAKYADRIPREVRVFLLEPR